MPGGAMGLRQQAGRLRWEGHQAAERGDVGRAVELFGAAMGIVRGLAADPGEEVDLQELAALGYSMGQLHLVADQPKAALAALDESERAYLAIPRGPEHPEPPDDEPVAAKVADVRMRRAQVHRALGQDLSALVDADAAVMGHLYVHTRPLPAREPVEWTLDLARVLSLHARVLVPVGDADLAVGAADTAVRLYLRHAADVNSDPVRQSIHLDRLGEALGVAHAIHLAFDRPEPAQAALVVSQSAGVDQLPHPATREQLRHLPTFAEALARLGAHADVRSLTKPAAVEEIEATLFATGQRGNPETNPPLGLALARLATRTIDDQPLPAFRVALETHVLLCSSQRLAPERLDAVSQLLRPVWADMLRLCSRWVAGGAPSGRPMALDIAHQMTQVVNDMTDDARAGTGDCAAASERCQTWNRELLASLESDND